MGNRDYGIKDMHRADWIWQGLIVVEVIVMAVGLVLGTDTGEGGDRVGIVNLVKALFGSSEVESAMWLWVARSATIILIATITWYVRKVKPHTVG